MEESSEGLNARGVEGSRKRRRERYLPVIMDILKNGEWHSLRDIAYEVKLTAREVAGFLRGEAVVRDDKRVKLGRCDE
jgi:hypothetical protein